MVSLAPYRGRVASGKSEIAYLEWGLATAPLTVIAVHGFAQTADFMAPLARALLSRGDVRLIAPDLRAHGDSDDFDRGPADEVFVADLWQLWSTAVGRPARWFGNSLGARVVALTCAAHPIVAERLILGECLVGLERLWAFLSARARQMAQARPARFGSLPEARSYGAEVRHLRDTALELWLAHALRSDGDGWVEKLRTGYLDRAYWPEREAELRAQLHSIEAPIDLVYCAQGSALSPTQQQEVCGLFRSAQRRFLSDAGHDLFLDAPDALAELINIE